MSGALAKPRQVQQFYFCRKPIPVGNWGARSSVLPVEEVHLRGHHHCNIIPLPKVSCSSMDCASSVSGPSRPAMTSACCSQFQPGVCDAPPIRSLPPMNEAECQRRCWADPECRYFSSSLSACLLHFSCSPQGKPCQECRSGPKRPLLEKIDEDCSSPVTTTTATITTSSTPTSTTTTIGTTTSTPASTTTTISATGFQF